MIDRWQIFGNIGKWLKNTYIHNKLNYLTFLTNTEWGKWLQLFVTACSISLCFFGIAKNQEEKRSLVISHWACQNGLHVQVQFKFILKFTLLLILLNWFFSLRQWHIFGIFPQMLSSMISLFCTEGNRNMHRWFLIFDDLISNFSTLQWIYKSSMNSVEILLWSLIFSSASDKQYDTLSWCWPVGMSHSSCQLHYHKSKQLINLQPSAPSQPFCFHLQYSIQ